MHNSVLQGPELDLLQGGDVVDAEVAPSSVAPAAMPMLQLILPRGARFDAGRSSNHRRGGRFRGLLPLAHPRTLDFEVCLRRVAIATAARRCPRDFVFSADAGGMLWRELFLAQDLATRPPHPHGRANRRSSRWSSRVLGARIGNFG